MDASVDQAVKIINKRSNRAIATILGVKERECDPYLDAAAKERLRKTVLDQVNELADLAVDCVRSITPEGIGNEHYMATLVEIHKGMEIMVASLEE